MTGADSAEDLAPLLTQDEGPTLEFKASLRFDLKTSVVNRDLTKVVAKTAAGFLNTDGGTLLIGVSNEGEVLGIKSDLATLSEQTQDRFEQTARNVIAKHLGPEVSPLLRISFVLMGEETVARVDCDPHPTPVFLQDGEQQYFYVRDGNRTVPLDVKSTHEYVATRWPVEPLDTAGNLPTAVAAALTDPDSGSMVSQLLDDAINAEIERRMREAVATGRHAVSVPNWLQVSTRRVIDLFLAPLARAPDWRRLYIVSPWISPFAVGATLSFDRFLERISEDHTTTYVVTRPPEEEWHADAIERLGQTGRVNLVLVPQLHMKLYLAETRAASFAVLGSANFTQGSLENRELGLRVNAHAEGTRLIRDLRREAFEVYRAPERELAFQARFDPIGT
jgi:hypothetical protein